jgi:glucose/mannose-6-phosphate isomerase
VTQKLEELRARHDVGDMLGKVAGFPAQMREAWKIGAEFAPRVEAGDYRAVVVCGMGGSAIGGDMLRSLFGERLRAPIVSCRDYAVPAYLARDSFVIVSSYSGNTGETLSAYDSLGGTGAARVAVSTGGALEARCRADGVPFCRIPGGLPPRSAIGYSLLPMVHILRAAGLADFDDAEYDEALEAVEALCEACALGADPNPAVDLALELTGRLPFVYAAPGLLEAVARRWACQFNENSKMLAHFAYYPELNHNEIVGWETQVDLMENVVVVSLEDVDDHEMTGHHTDISLGIVEPLAGGIVRLRSEEGARMKRMLTTMLLGDFTSVYLALLAGVDPTPVAKIDFLKQQLKNVEK